MLDSNQDRFEKGTSNGGVRNGDKRKLRGIPLPVWGWVVWGGKEMCAACVGYGGGDSEEEVFYFPSESFLRRASQEPTGGSLRNRHFFRKIQ